MSVENVTTSWPQLTELSAKGTRKQAQILIRATLQRYPSSGIGPESVAAFTNDWAQMIGQVGIRRFWNGVTKAIQSTTFFPVLADIRKHLPSPESLSEYHGPTPEDVARRAAGERNYGTADTWALWDIHRGLRLKAGRPLNSQQLEWCLAELDRRIDKVEQK